MTLFKRSPRGKEIQGASSGACLLPPEEGGKLSGWKQVKRDMAGGGGGAQGGGRCLPIVPVFGRLKQEGLIQFSLKLM